MKNKEHATGCIDGIISIAALMICLPLYGWLLYRIMVLSNATHGDFLILWAWLTAHTIFMVIRTIANVLLKEQS